MRRFGWLFRQSSKPVQTDGFGQSLLDDLLWIGRVRRYRQMAMTWRKPTADEEVAIVADPLLGRFGDDTIGLAEINGLRCIVRDHDWFGWPDPPRFVFFALAGNRVVAAAGFHDWPSCWTPAPPDYSIVTPTTFQSPPS
ncbi:MULTISPECIES: hypothetical protein [unclassified Sphingomonas]|uniref:hypothetical protein n=1 Tax=unclassified Sphingomonas TaxID=196159 RepID=UPI0006F69077|nr:MULTISPECIES: hypothetical protein [unclassified Sphingomonas]KQM61467.1 hypothetical protein ASE65_08020 [Sphingomonas sp. Leaf16]KQN12562.1 hypothetical protein ASE81_09030 [Sphingomonas sp. Leaf29]KQN19042.1 hypothetical protein ASE83_08955 [Sphingomonas sp. Leaf32]